MDLSVIIINHNTKELTAQTIASVQEQTRDISFEIVVVDNSTDLSKQYELEDYLNLKVLYGIENRGFGHACNLGAQKAEGRYLLFLNSDTIVHDGALQKCVEYMKSHPDIGALGIRTLLQDGTLDHGCKRGFPTPGASLFYFLGLDKKHPESKKYGAYRQTFIGEHQTSQVDAVSGSFLMMPAQLFNSIGGFDEDYFMYGEDLDLCYRVKKQGYQVVYYADAWMTHLKGQSGLHTKSRKVIYHFHHAMILFYRKHYMKQYSIFTTVVVYCGIGCRYALSLARSLVSRG